MSAEAREDLPFEIGQLDSQLLEFANALAEYNVEAGSRCGRDLRMLRLN